VAGKYWASLLMLIPPAWFGGVASEPILLFRVRAKLPPTAPAEGLVVDAGEGRRFGAWLIPDNQAVGMMETWLEHLRPGLDSDLQEHTRNAMRAARDHGAPWKEVHADKAEIHPWPAWQDPPGQQLHGALMRSMLDASSENAKPFIA
jgi:hypothetical protein